MDRIDGESIFCEDANGEEVILNTKSVIGKVREGDVVFINDDGRAFLDKNETSARRKEILSLRKKLNKIDT